MKKFFAILGAFVVALSCLLIPVFGNDNYAKADTTFNPFIFNGSNLCFNELGLSSSSSVSTSNLTALTYYNANYDAFNYSFQISSYLVDSDVYISFKIKGFNRQGSLYPAGSSYNVNTFYECSNWMIYNGISSSLDENDTIRFTIQNFTNYYTYFRCALNGSNVVDNAIPNGVMTMVEIGNYTVIDNFGSSNFGTGYYNYIKYYDTAGWEYYYCIPVAYVNANSYANRPNLYYSKRTYYLTNSLEGSDEYQAGYDNGYIDGLNEGNDNGYSDGYSAGNTAGYNNGYNAGLNDANQYTFFNLFGSVLDAPVSVLMSILNFQLLGVNLWALFTGLLTLAVFIFVLKLFIGGK